MRVKTPNMFHRPPGEDEDDWEFAVDVWSTTKFETPQDALLDFRRSVDRLGPLDDSAEEVSWEDLPEEVVAATIEHDWNQALEINECWGHPNWGYLREKYTNLTGSPVSHLILAEFWTSDSVQTVCGWTFGMDRTAETYSTIPETKRLCRDCSRFVEWQLS